MKCSHNNICECNYFKISDSHYIIDNVINDNELLKTER